LFVVVLSWCSDPASVVDQITLFLSVYEQPAFQAVVSSLCEEPGGFWVPSAGFGCREQRDEDAIGELDDQSYRAFLIFEAPARSILLRPFAVSSPAFAQAPR